MNTVKIKICKFSLEEWRYQRSNQSQNIKEEPTTQWPNEKVQKDKQLQKNCIYKTYTYNWRSSNTNPTKSGCEFRCSGRVSSSCSTSGTRCVNLVTNPMINREWGKDREVFTTSGTYSWSFVTQIFHNGQPSHGGDSKTFLTYWNKYLSSGYMMMLQ